MAATLKTTRPTKMSKKRKLEDMSVEEFFMNSDSEDTSSEASAPQQLSPSKRKKVKKTTPAKPAVVKLKKKTSDSNGKKRNSLQDLKERDPEFYEFLLKEDRELLEDDDDEDDDDDDEDEAEEVEEKDDDESDGNDESFDSDDSDDDGEDRFQPPKKLEVASDEDDDDDDIEDDDSGSDGQKKQKTKRNLITAAMVKTWKQQAEESPSPDLLRQWVSALAAAAQHAGISVEAETQYRVDTDAGFNIVMRLCLSGVVPLLERLLTVRSLGEQAQMFSKKNKKWKAIRGTAKNYCIIMLQLSGEFSEAGMVNVVLRHIHKLVVCFGAFPKLAKIFLKRMVKVWSSGEETSRVLAFLCLNKLVRLQPDLLDLTLKQMYMAYINNCKFVSPSSLPVIGLMQRSLVEVLLLQDSLAYQHAFLYIRQLAIHLRNAITTKKKESCQLVYNWQYVLSLALWAQLLTTAHPSPVLQPLVFPLVQVITGTIRLMPTAQYYPLRFHCVRYLTMLSETAYVPVLPFLLEVLEQTDFNKRQKGGGQKNMNLSTILKFSKSQIQEKAFKEVVIEQLCELLFDFLNAHSHTAAFPEMIVPLIVQLKEFTKKCKVAVLCRQVKQVVDKAEETARVVENRRRNTTFHLTDTKAMEVWENRNKEEGTPLSKFYLSWRKMQDRKKQKEMAARDQMTTAGESMVPEMARPAKGPTPKASAEDREQFGTLFDSDDEADDDTFRFLPKKDRKEANAQELDSDEDYSDFDSDDLEQLAKSGSEEDDDDDDDDDDDEEEEQEEEKHRKKGIKRKKQPQKTPPPPQQKSKPKKVRIENDRGDSVQDFTWSDSD